MSVFRILHITKYDYEKTVTESVNEIRIFPYQCEEQEVLQHELTITNHPDVLVYKDYWGNKAGLFSIVEPHKELVIETKILIRTTMSPRMHSFWTSSFVQLQEEALNNLELLELSKAERIQNQDSIVEIAKRFYDAEKSIATIVEECNEYIFSNFTYSKGITTIETTIDEILEHQTGVCQDFAHLMLQILRTMDIPCRYVSGYICPHKNGMRGEGATHAWIEAWIPGHGWAGIDPTNNVWVDNKHVKLAVGRNFTDCSVAKGTYKGTAKQSLYVFVSVGYEDGVTFEETTQVQLEKQRQSNREQEVARMAEAHEQQQQ